MHMQLQIDRDVEKYLGNAVQHFLRSTLLLDAMQSSSTVCSKSERNSFAAGAVQLGATGRSGGDC